MNEEISYITCRPSQLLNLGNLLQVIILIPLLFILDRMLGEFISARFVPDKIVFLLRWFPLILAAVAGTSFFYRLLQVRSIRYEITPEQLRCYSGILNRRHEYIELYRVKDFTIERKLLYRFFGLGTLVIYTSDKTSPVLRLEAIPQTEDTYTVLRGFVERSRREKHVFEVD